MPHNETKTTDLSTKATYWTLGIVYFALSIHWSNIVANPPALENMTYAKDVALMDVKASVSDEAQGD